LFAHELSASHRECERGDPERHSQWFKDVKFRTHGLTYTANADGMALLAWGCGAENRIA